MYGRRNIYIVGLAVFTISSLFCGFSAGIGELIGFRVIQATGGAIIVAKGVLIVVDAFPRHELGKAMGILSMIMAGTFVVGPILGGFLTTIDWRLNFFFECAHRNSGHDLCLVPAPRGRGVLCGGIF